MIVRAETAADQRQVRDVHLLSFPTSAEANLVDAVRAEGDAEISFVAETDGDIIGHVVCSPMKAPFRALGLGPIAVVPAFRKQSVADRLIRAAIAEARLKAWDVLFVLGDPKYYRRFGFSVPDAAGFESQYAGPFLMVLSLQGETLPRRTGVIEYAPAFGRLD